MGYKLFETLYDCKYIYSIIALDYSLAGYRILVRKSFSFRIFKELLPCLSASKFEKANAILLLETLHNPTFYL